MLKSNIYMSHRNRGMTLENDINETNRYYLVNDIAVIYKKPTPITITKVDYPSRREAVVKEAYFKTPSTTDYNGVYRGKYIDFEAKETNLNYFPLANIHKHQVAHLKKIIAHGGIGFVIVRFNKFDKTFLLTATNLIDFIQKSTRKSIPVEYFEEKGYIVKVKFSPRIDYLKVIDELFFKGEVI